MLKEDLIMAKQHDKQFKLDAVQYYQDHKELGVRGCAEKPRNRIQHINKVAEGFPGIW